MLQGGVLSAILFPFASNIPEMPAPATQHSKPGYLGSTSNARPRPGPSPSSPALTDAFFQITSPVLASLKFAPASPKRSCIPNTSRPGLEGSRSETCNASPCPMPVAYNPFPLSSMVIWPKMISSLPSASTSVTDKL